MKIEHLAVNVSEPVKMAQWYVAHLGMAIVQAMDQTPFTHFLSDRSGMMIEIYSNPTASVPDYRSMHPLLLHLAFVSDDPEVDCIRLEKAGATFVEKVGPTKGTHLIMMRDPWGLPIQLCKRKW